MNCTCGGRVQHADTCPVYQARAADEQRALDDTRAVAVDFEEMLGNFHRTEIPQSQEELSALAKRRYCREALRRTDR